jgi:predicted DNA-binding transcriptional regulator AlpA
MTDGPRLISRKEAAAYCGIAESTFSMWVSTRKMPATIPGTRKWDKRAIDAKLDEISGLGGLPPDKTETDFQKWKRERDKRRRAKE